MEDRVLTTINAAQYLTAVAQTNQIFQWIQIGLAILCSIVLLAYRIWKWYKDSKADGKITSDELKQLIIENKDEVIDIIEKTTDLVNDIKENSKNE